MQVTHLPRGPVVVFAAAVAHKLGHCDDQITVHMPGGVIQIEIGAHYAIRMTGPTTRVGTYELDLEALRQDCY